jgi:hypothetical protein
MPWEQEGASVLVVNSAERALSLYQAHVGADIDARSVEHGFTAFLYRPYFDLGPVAEDAPVASWGVEFACRSMVDARDYPWLYAEYPPSFRRRLIQITGLSQYAVEDPRALAPDLQTGRWRQLCEQVNMYSSLASDAQRRVARLLGKLGLCQFLLDLVPQPGESGIRSSEALAELAYLRALADLLIAEDADGSFDETQLERIALLAPQGSHVRILALNHLAVRHAKRDGDVARVSYWLGLHHQQIEHSRLNYGEDTFTRLLSRHHRATGFVPQLRGDRAGVVREMDLCQQFAERLPRDTFEQRLSGNELLFAALESRTKEALWLGDLGAA